MLKIRKCNFSIYNQLNYVDLRHFVTPLMIRYLLTGSLLGFLMQIGIDTDVLIDVYVTLKQETCKYMVSEVWIDTAIFINVYVTLKTNKVELYLIF